MPNKRPTKVWVEETPVCPGHWVHFNSKMARLLRAGGFTPRPGHIYVPGEFLSIHLHAHEGGHLVQIETLGWPRFAARYVASLVKPHDQRPLEINAEEFASTHEVFFSEVYRP